MRIAGGNSILAYKIDKFDENCYDLQILRRFRDNFVSQEDIEHYYQTVPVVVEAIDKMPENNSIYNSIYKNVITVCVKAIEQKNYELVYSTYKNNILELEERFARPLLQKRLVKTLGSTRNLGFSN